LTLFRSLRNLGSVRNLRNLQISACLLASLALAGSEPVARIPFTWTPGQIEVPVRVDDVPATFLLDTGSEYSVVSTRLAGLLDLTTDRSRGRDFAEDITLRVGGLSLEHQRVMVMPFDTYYARGRHIDGLLGYDFFSRFVTAIDVGARTITLWAPSAFRAPKTAVAVPIEFAGRLPIVSCTLTVEGGRLLPARLVIDTAASQGVILRYPFANENGLLDMASTATTAPSLASGELRLIDIPIEQMSLSRWTFDRPRVQAQREPIGSGASTASDGLVGTGLLSRFTLIVDYPHRRLLLQPPRHAQ
jgi:hypothetical protein